MRPVRRSLTLWGVGLALLGCTGSPAGLGPGAEGPSSTPGALGPSAQPAPSPAPSPVAAPSPLASGGERAAPLRVEGTVTVVGQPVADASLVALDLATGAALRLGAPGQGGAEPAPTHRTDARGAFALTLPPLAAGQVVKLVAVAGSRTFVGLVDAQGRAPGGPPAGYALRQAGPLAVRLTPAGTAVAKAFEGVLRLHLQRPAAARDAGLARALAAAGRALAVLEEALARRPELAGDLVAGLTPAGELPSADALRAALSRLGVFDRLAEAVRGELAPLTAEPLTIGPGIAAIAVEDFPLDRPDIGVDGRLEFSGLSAAISLRGEGAAWLPTPERHRRRRQDLAFELVSWQDASATTRVYGSAYDNRYLLLTGNRYDLRVFDTATGVLRQPVASAGFIPAANQGLYGAVRMSNSRDILVLVDPPAASSTCTIYRGTPSDASLSAFTWAPYLTLPFNGNALVQRAGKTFILNAETAATPTLYRLDPGPTAVVVPVGNPPLERLFGSGAAYDVIVDDAPGVSDPRYWVMAQHPTASSAIWQVDPTGAGTSAIVLDGIDRGRGMAYASRRRQLYAVYDTGPSYAVMAVDTDTWATSRVTWQGGSPDGDIRGLVMSPDGQVLYGFMP